MQTLVIIPEIDLRMQHRQTDLDCTPEKICWKRERSLRRCGRTIAAPLIPLTRNEWLDLSRLII